VTLSFFLCGQCGKPAWQATGAVNRALQGGHGLYCNRTCAGLSRRTGKTAAQKKEEKRLYDQQYRITNLTEIKVRKRAYHKRTYDPAKAAKERKARMSRHVEYCRQPEYRAKKAQYDRRYNMERSYGPFWEAGRVLADLEREIRSLASDYEIRVQNDTLNKLLKRKRAYAQVSGDNSRQRSRSVGGHAEERSLGNA
jgi:hypothetical protein